MPARRRHRAPTLADAAKAASVPPQAVRVPFASLAVVITELKATRGAAPEESAGTFVQATAREGCRPKGRRPTPVAASATHSPVAASATRPNKSTLQPHSSSQLAGGWSLIVARGGLHRIGFHSAHPRQPMNC